jgi:hypothetical protein
MDQTEMGAAKHEGNAPKLPNMVSKGARSVAKGVYSVFEPEQKAVTKVIVVAVIGFVLTVGLLSYGIRMCAPERQQLFVQHTETSLYALDVVPSDTLSGSFEATAVANAPRVYEYQIFFSKYPRFLLWVLLVSIMVGFSLACLPLFIKFHHWLTREFIVPRITTDKHLWTVVGLGVVLFLTPLILPGMWSTADIVGTLHIVFEGNYVLLIPFLVTVSCAMAGILALFAMGVGLAEIRLPDPPPKEPAETWSARVQATRFAMLNIEHQFKRLAEMLRTCLLFMAITVGLSVAATGALRNAFLSMYHVEQMDIFPQEFVHGIGLFFTAFLAAVYLPIQFQLKAQGNELGRAMQVMEGRLDPASLTGKPPSTSFTAEGTGWDGFKQTLSILGPLLASFIPDLAKVLGG